MKENNNEQQSPVEALEQANTGQMNLLGFLGGDAGSLRGHVKYVTKTSPTGLVSDILKLDRKEIGAVLNLKGEKLDEFMRQAREDVKPLLAAFHTRITSDANWIAGSNAMVLKKSKKGKITAVFNYEYSLKSLLDDAKVAAYLNISVDELRRIREEKAKAKALAEEQAKAAEDGKSAEEKAAELLGLSVEDVKAMRALVADASKAVEAEEKAVEAAAAAEPVTE